MHYVIARPQQGPWRLAKAKPFGVAWSRKPKTGLPRRLPTLKLWEAPRNDDNLLFCNVFLIVIELRLINNV